MSGPGSGDDGSTGLDFERAELEGEASNGACASCGTPLAGAYFTAGELVVCERCRYALEEAHGRRGGAGRLARAALYGLGAGAAGALLWGIVTEVTGYEIGLVAIAVGWVVGTAIRAATGGRGGLPYQLMAVAVTYLAIVSTYIPAILETLDDEAAVEAEMESASSIPEQAGAEDDAPLEGAAFYVFVLVLAMMLPVLGGFENLIGMLIIGFALWQAWVLNRRAEITFQGPFELGSATPTS